jgi:acyl-homoserine lactone acylase PvdQ
VRNYAGQNTYVEKIVMKKSISVVALALLLAARARSLSFNQLAGASYREIFDLSDWDKARGVNVPGQSGQPGSPHYDDLLPLWSKGQYFPLRYTKPAVDRETTDVLELKP